MPRIVTALALGLASGFSSYERKEGCPVLYFRGVLALEFNPAFLHVDDPGRDPGLHRVRLTDSPPGPP